MAAAARLGACTSAASALVLGGTRFGFLLIAFCATTGCTSLKYTYSFGTSKMQHTENPERFQQLKFDHQTHEISGMDSSGVVCASIVTGGNAAEARDEAIDDAMPYQNSITYTYRVAQAREFQGLRCGGYFRWTASSQGVEFSPGNDIRFSYGEYDSENSMWEAGFVVDYGAELFEGAYIVPFFQLGVGEWSIDMPEGANAPDRSEAFGDASVGARLEFAPPWLLGLGVAPYAYFNIAGFSLNYGAEASFTVAPHEDFVIQAGALFEEREQWFEVDLITREFGIFGRVAYLW